MAGFGDKTLEYVIKATDHASSTLEHVGKNLDNTGRSFSLMGKAAKFAAIGVAAAITAVGVAFTAGVYAVVDFLKAAQEDIKVTARLTKVQKNAEKATKAQIRSTNQMADSLGLMSGVSNNLIKNAMIPLAATGMKVAESQDLMSVALDVSSARGLDLNAVTVALAKAYNGTTTSLARYGIQVKDANGDALSFGKIVDQLKEKFHGAAKAAGNTDPWARLTEAWDQVKEKLGKTLWPLFKRFVHWVIGTLVPWVKRHAADAFHWLAQKISDAWDFTQRLWGYLQRHQQVWKDLATSVGGVFSAFGKFLVALTGNAMGTGDGGAIGATKKAQDPAKHLGKTLDDMATSISTLNGYVQGFIDRMTWIAKNLPGFVKSIASLLPMLGPLVQTSGLPHWTPGAGSPYGQTGNIPNDPLHLFPGGGGSPSLPPGHSRSTSYVAPRMSGSTINVTVQGDTDPDGAAKRIEQHLYRLKRTRGSLAFQ